MDHENQNRKCFEVSQVNKTVQQFLNLINKMVLLNCNLTENAKKTH